MRQIFSVILAAALVFGGALLMAGYFDGIEVRGAGPKEGELGPFAEPPREGNQIRGTLWHCPEVDRILAGPLAGFFEGAISQRNLRRISDDFSWERVVLYNFDHETDARLGAQFLTCEYVRELKQSDYDLDPQVSRRPIIRLSLPSKKYKVEIPYPTMGSETWQPGEGIGINGGYDVYFTQAFCLKSARECEFSVMSRE